MQTIYEVQTEINRCSINNSPLHQNRPPISRNTVVGENRNNAGNVNQEQNSSHFNSQRQSSVAGDSPTNATQREMGAPIIAVQHNTEKMSVTER